MKKKFSMFLILLLTVFSGFSAAIFAEEIETEKTWPANDGFEIFKQNEKLGVRTTAGEVVISPNYDKVSVNDVFSFLYINDKNGLAEEKMGIASTKTWEIIVPPHHINYDYYDELIYGEGRNADRFGDIETEGIILYVDINLHRYLINQEGKLLGGKSWKMAEVFTEGLAYVMDDTGKEMYINRWGEVAIPSSENWQGGNNHLRGGAPFSNGRARVLIAEGWGYINTCGEIVIKGAWEKADHFYDGMALVKNEKGWGYIDIAGRDIVSCQYTRADVFCQGVARVEVNEKFGLIKKDGTYLLEPVWDGINVYYADELPVKGEEQIRYFSDGVVKAYKKNEEGIQISYYTEEGELVSSGWRSGEMFQEGLCIVRDEQGYAMLNKEGKITRFPVEIDVVAENFGNGLLLASIKEGKYGFLNKELEWVLKPIWDSGMSYYEGLAAVKSGGKWGCIDEWGKFIIPCEYDFIDFSGRGYILPEKNEGFDVYDYQGNMIEQQRENGVYINLNT